MVGLLMAGSLSISMSDLLAPLLDQIATRIADTPPTIAPYSAISTGVAAGQRTSLHHEHAQRTAGQECCGGAKQHNGMPPHIGGRESNSPGRVLSAKRISST